jgi:transposase
MKILYPKYYNSGRSSKLSSEDKKRLNNILEKEEYLNQKKVRKILKEEFNVEYCPSQQSLILTSLGFHYTKLFQYIFQKTKYMPKYCF